MLKPIFLLTGLALLQGAAQAQSLPTVSCSSPDSIFNTGVNADGTLRVRNTSEVRWEYVPHPVEDTNNYTAYPAWNTPMAAWTSPGVWNWTNFSDAQWIAPNTSLSATRYTYYRFRFNLDAAVNPAQFQVAFDLHVDDFIPAVFVNGTKVGTVVGTGFAETPPGSGRYFTVPAQFLAAQGWQVGQNELVLQVMNAGGSTLTSARPLSGVLLKGRGLCGQGSAQVSKSFAQTQLKAGDTTTLTIGINNQTKPAVPLRDLWVKDVLPAPLEVAGPATSSCTNHVLTAPVGGNSVELTGVANPTAAQLDMVPTGGCSISVPVRWPASAAAQCVAGPTVTNTITPGTKANGGGFSTAGGFNATPASAQVQCTAPQLNIDKSQPVPALQVGSPSTYTITVRNVGSASVAGATVLEALPPGLTLDSATGTNWSCNAASPMQCTYSAAVAAGAAAAPLQVKVLALAGQGQAPVINHASVDPTGGNTPPTPGPTCAPAAACATVTSDAATLPRPVPGLGAWALMGLMGVVGLMGAVGRRKPLRG